MSLVTISAKGIQSVELDGATFRYHPLTGRQACQLADVAATGERALCAWKTVAMALAGWDGVVDENGAPVAFDEQRDAEDQLEQIPVSTVIALGGRIFSRVQVTEEQAKNSPSQSAE